MKLIGEILLRALDLAEGCLLNRQPRAMVGEVLGMVIAAVMILISLGLGLAAAFIALAQVVGAAGGALLTSLIALLLAAAIFLIARRWGRR